MRPDLSAISPRPPPLIGPSPRPYCGRFAPSPTGPLHAGSLVAALASWLDARAAGGTWLVRIEDLDPPREVPGASEAILATLDRLGLHADEPPCRQSERTGLYAAALDRLRAIHAVYACHCSRRDVELAAQARGLAPGVYPGTCRGLDLAAAGFAWRLRVDDAPVAFVDRMCGPFAQQLEREVGDFVLRRADGLWAYQLAVVVDDAAQGITAVVRGADLLDNTPRQIALQRALGLPTPAYLHVPLVLAADGSKLSKQSGAQALDEADALGELERAAGHLGLPRVGATHIDTFLQRATACWAERLVESPAPASR